MSGNKEGSVLGQIVVAVVVALLAGGTSPWWWDKFSPSNKPSTSQLSGTDSRSLQATNSLQVGEYRFNNNYLDVFQKGERICIRVTSPNGSNVASVYVNSNDSSQYLVENYGDNFLMQKNPTTVSFSGSDFTKDNDYERGFSSSSDEVVQRCLDSSDRFFLERRNEELYEEP